MERLFDVLLPGTSEDQVLSYKGRIADFALLSTTKMMDVSMG